MYDVIVVGARVAGSATAMLLARAGLHVLLVDKAAFPSETLSTHQVQLPGVARLERWGLLARIAAAGTPATRRVRFDPGPVALEGSYPAFEGIDALYSPRRSVLDTILVEAAREAGAEVRERFTIEEILIADSRVAVIRGRERGRASTIEKARIVIGADGRHSLVARTMRARSYRQKPARTFAYYTYWRDVAVDGGEMYARPQRMIGAWPTNDGLVMTYVAGPIDEFHAFRSNIEANMLSSLDLARDLGERVRGGARAERYYGTAQTGSYFRTPYGPGWALVGDAGLAMDPVTGQGISDAFRDAELLANAIIAGLSDGTTLDAALTGYERARNEAVTPMYDFTTDVASLRPPRLEQHLLFDALAHDDVQARRFFGVLAGAFPIPQFFSPSNLRRMIGLRGFAKIAASKLKPRRLSAAAAVVALASTVPVAAPPSDASAKSRLLLRADFPAAMAPLRDGGLVYGELRDGRIWRVDARGRRPRRPLATVAVSTDGYKGLLGLAVDRRGSVFAAFTTPAPSEQLGVARVWPRPARLLWRGPPAAAETNGGRIAFAPNGRLLVTIGDRLTSLKVTPSGIVWPAWPGFQGAVLSLDPSGPADQHARLLSRGWFNPFGLAIAPSGAIWVADNAVPGAVEHLARADLGPRPELATALPPEAPAGLAASGRDLFVCGYVSHRLERYRIGASGRARRTGPPLARDCSVGVISLGAGTLAYANERQIRIINYGGRA